MEKYINTIVLNGVHPAILLNYYVSKDNLHCYEILNIESGKSSSSSVEPAWWIITLKGKISDEDYRTLEALWKCYYVPHHNDEY